MRTYLVKMCKRDGSTPIGDTTEVSVDVEENQGRQAAVIKAEQENPGMEVVAIGVDTETAMIMKRLGDYAPRYWILGPDGRTPMSTDSVERWAECMKDDAAKRVAYTHDEKKGITVSTVFLGLDHGFGREGGPVLFETMIFGGQSNDWMRRYSHWVEAEQGHKLACEVAGISFVPQLPSPDTKGD
jgi:hypothetical protein